MGHFLSVKSTRSKFHEITFLWYINPCIVPKRIASCKIHKGEQSLPIVIVTWVGISISKSDMTSYDILGRQGCDIHPTPSNNWKATQGQVIREKLSLICSLLTLNLMTTGWQPTVNLRCPDQSCWLVEPKWQGQKPVTLIPKNPIRPTNHATLPQVLDGSTFLMENVRYAEHWAVPTSSRCLRPCMRFKLSQTSHASTKDLNSELVSLKKRFSLRGKQTKCKVEDTHASLTLPHTWYTTSIGFGDQGADQRQVQAMALH